MSFERNNITKSHPCKKEMMQKNVFAFELADEDLHCQQKKREQRCITDKTLMLQIITSSRYLIDRKRIRLCVEKIFVEFKIDPSLSTNIIFVGKNKMRSIASTYKHEDIALPVLAFPYRSDTDMTEPLLGEIFLCYPQVVLLAAERNKRLDPLIDELIIHGIKNLLK